jgi:2,3-bisphosphoglycerate-independent phosphoglycerate mutase
MKENRVLLMILDGWGIGDGSGSDVISTTGTPHIDELKKIYPSSSLLTSGEDVGLPEGQMGNSEVGHLNIGAGRVVYQDLVKINKACRTGEIRSNGTLRRPLPMRATGTLRYTSWASFRMAAYTRLTATSIPSAT